MTTEQQAAVLTLQNSVGCAASDGVGNFQYYFPEVSEHLTEEEIEELLKDKQVQQDAGVGICSFCNKYEYLVDLYESTLSYGKSMCFDCGGGR